VGVWSDNVKPNRVREVLSRGGVPVGHMISEFGTRGIAKIVEPAALDFLMIDMEHTGFDHSHVADLVAWLKATTVAPLVRVPQGLYHFIARVLDAGALGVMVANVETPGQAHDIVRAAKYAPLGNRGVGLGTAHNDFIMPDPATFFREANENIQVICQIESTRGLDNVDAIAGTDGVDMLWVGQFDLTQSMGIPGQFETPQAVAALRRIAEAARQRGKAAGIQPGNPQQAEAWLAFGYNVISWKNDASLYRDALRNEVNALRTLISGAQQQREQRTHNWQL